MVSLWRGLVGVCGWFAISTRSPQPPPLGCNPWGNGALQEHMTIFWLDSLVGQAALFFESPWECRRRGSMFGDIPHVGSEAACTELHDAHVLLFPCCVCTQPWFRRCTRSLLRASRICVHLAVTASWSLRWKRSSPPTWCTMTSTSMRKWRWRAAPFRTCLLCRPIARRKATKSSSNTSPTCPSKSFNQSRLPLWMALWICQACQTVSDHGMLSEKPAVCSSSSSKRRMVSGRLWNSSIRPQTSPSAWSAACVNVRRLTLMFRGLGVSVPNAMERLPYAVVAARGDSDEDTGVPAPGNPAGRRPRSTSPQTPPANHWQLMLGPTQRLPQSPRSWALQNLVRRAGAWTCPGGLADGTLYPCCTSTVMDKLWQAAFNFCVACPCWPFFYLETNQGLWPAGTKN